MTDEKEPSAPRRLLGVVPESPSTAGLPPVGTRRKPGRPPMSDARAAKLEDARRWGKAVMRALDLVDAAASTATSDLAIPRALAAAELLEAEQARAVAAALAVETVWKMPPAVAVPDEAGRIVDRQRQLREWTWGRRAAVTSTLARIRKILKEVRPRG